MYKRYERQNDAVPDFFCVFYYNPCYSPPKRKHSKRDISEYQPKSGTQLAWEYANKRRNGGISLILITTLIVVEKESMNYSTREDM
jgi:hypothetical protein